MRTNLGFYILFLIVFIGSDIQAALADVLKVSDGLAKAEKHDDVPKSGGEIGDDIVHSIEQSLSNVKQEFDKFIDSLSYAYRRPNENVAAEDESGDVEKEDAGSRRQRNKKKGDQKRRDRQQKKVGNEDKKIPAVEDADSQDVEEILEENENAFDETKVEHIKDNPDKDEKAVNETKVVDVADETKTVKDGDADLKDDSDCIDCDTPTMTPVDYRIEKFKAQLLEKLGLTEPPQVDGPIHPLPSDFYIGENFAVNDEPEDEEKEDNLHKVKTREIFVFGTDVTESCLNKKGAGCYSFNLTDKGIDPKDVGSVELWIYKQADLNDHHIQTFVVSELNKKQRKGKEYLQSRSIVQRIETRLKYGWMKIYVNRMVLRWLSKPHRNNGLAVVCKTCKWKGHKTIYGEKEGMMPFLVFYMNRHISHRFRSKRETRCLEGGANCCRREHLEINFRDIGWDYIMAPPSIRPNYCTGSCNGIHAAYYNHTRLVQMLQQSVMHEFTPLQPCCSPVHFRRTQSLLYRDHQGAIRKIDIPDLIVGECGCT